MVDFGGFKNLRSLRKKESLLHPRMATPRGQASKTRSRNDKMVMYLHTPSEYIAVWYEYQTAMTIRIIHRQFYSETLCVSFPLSQ
jgi:hypothetical protein